MCGIAGIVNYRPSENVLPNLLALSKSIEHRGPDAEGIFIDSDRTVAFAHRRLSIIDLTEGANQPFISADSNYIIVYNGEIYNYQSIKEELVQLGFSFKTNSDTEVLLNAYIAWSYACLEKFNGIFAFAIFDKTQDIVFLARDKFGIKPLYYFERESTLYFSSELKAFLSLPFFNKKIDKTALFQFLVSGFIVDDKTIFEEARRVEKDSYIIYSLNNATKSIVKNSSFAGSVNEFDVDQLYNIFKEEVKEQMVADVPVGVFLSGGIDSSLITAFAQQNNSNITSYSIGSDSSGLNENRVAENVASVFNIKHKSIEVENNEFVTHLEKFIEILDEPYSDLNLISIYLICLQAKKDGIKVMLTGDGGDELFLGYPNDLLKMKLFKFNKLVGKMPKLKLLTYLFSFSNKAYKFYDILTLSFEEACMYITGNGLTPHEARNILGENISIENTSFYSSLHMHNDIRQNLIQSNINTYLVANGFTKSDLGGMKTGVEIRVPILGKRIADYALKLNLNSISTETELKFPLKKLLLKFLPYEMVYRKKQGFNPVKLRELVKNELKPLIDDLLNETAIKKQGIFKYEVIREIIGKDTHVNNSHKIWRLLIFQLWFKKINSSY